MKLVNSACCTIAVLLVTALATSALAAGSVGVHRYVGLTLSPDAEQIATVETGPQHPIVVVRSADNGKVVANFDPCKACAYADPAWSPDSKSLVFVGWDSESRKSWAWLAQGKSLRKIAVFDGLLAKPRYSSDGKALAVLATEHPSKEAEATSPGPPLVGDLDAAPTDERRVAVVDTSSLRLRLISPADRYVYEYDWMPDGKGFIVTDAMGNPDNDWVGAKIESVDLTTGAARTLAASKIPIHYRRVSLNGSSIFVIGGVMDDLGDASTGGDIWTIPMTGGEPRNLTPGFKGTFTSLHSHAGRLYATAVVFDRYTLFVMGEDGNLKSLWSDESTIQAGDGRVSLSADATRMATTQQSFSIAPRIIAGPLNEVRPITHDNDGLIANTDARSIRYTNDGLNIHGWLLAPKNLQSGKTYPLAVYVHGGPAHFQEARFHWQDDDDVYGLLEHDYFVFMPNYRGSFGQGLEYQRATFMDWGGGDFRDILAGIDAVEKIAPIDENRLAIFGHSYGGYMAAWAVTQTDRFKAAIVSAGVTDWFFDYSLAGVPKYQDAYFHGITPYDRPEIFEKISPLRFVKQAKTPVFLYGGDADVEAPIAEAVAFWHALKALGVPTSLVIYAGEGHKFSNPANGQDQTVRTIAWFDKYVGGGAR